MNFYRAFASIVSNLVVKAFHKVKLMMLDICMSRSWRNGRYASNWSFASKSINPVVGDNQGLIFGDTTLFLNQLLVIVFCFRLALHTLCCFIVNKLPQVSEEEKNLGLTFFAARRVL
jgi:Amt family ammonium transporter